MTDYGTESESDISNWERLHNGGVKLTEQEREEIEYKVMSDALDRGEELISAGLRDASDYECREYIREHHPENYTGTYLFPSELGMPED